MTSTADRAVFVNSSRLGSFSFSEDHPFKPSRIIRVYRMCERRGLFSAPGLRVIDVEEAEDGVLERFHTPEYIDALRRADGGTEIDIDMLRHGIGSAENPIFRGVLAFSAISATASLAAARAIAGGAGCAFNPCGGFHHARPDRAGGFCYVNDVAIAIEELRAAGLRTAYVDIDAHHGDAVQDAFYEDPGVFTVSIHETGKTLFPWGGFDRELGEGTGRGYNLNVPLEPETDDEIFGRLFDGVVMDALDRFDPEVVVAQVGTDMLATDPLTHLRLTNNGYIGAIERLHRRFPRILALGGGGYRMEDVVRGWTLVWVELSGQELDAGYGGAIGGVLLGDPSIDGSDLRDMRLYTTGPAKERLSRLADEAIERYRAEARPLIAAPDNGAQE